MFGKGLDRLGKFVDSNVVDKVATHGNNRIDNARQAAGSAHGVASLASVVGALDKANEWVDHAKHTANKAKEDAKQAASSAKDDAVQAASLMKDGINHSLATQSGELQSRLMEQMDAALSKHDSVALNTLLDNAHSAKLLECQHVPGTVKRVAHHVAGAQLQRAIESGEPRRLKGALVAAKRLNAVSLPEFEVAVQKYQEVKQIPLNWDVSKMVLHREGSRMVAKLPVEDPAIKAHFQLLLDATHRRVYTRDRSGQAVPERFELLAVRAITNEDVWGDYMARREAIRQELAADGTDFQHYSVDTSTTSTDAEATACASAGSASLESVSTSLAADFAEPLLPEVNEVFLFHGTKEAAVHKITTGNVRINLAGSNAGTLYGRGVYFAENSTKSDEYTLPIDGVRHMLLCRVTLGRVLYSDTKETDPRACEDACLSGRFHSVLGDRRKCRGTFREFVVFDEEQVYPNYIIDYRRVDAPVDTVRTVQVQCPVGATPGGLLQFTTPDGQPMSVAVPAGVQPGQHFTVQY